MSEKSPNSARIKIEDLETITATHAKNRFGEMLHKVCYEKKPVLIGKSGRPMAVVIDVDQYLELKRAARPEKKPNRKS